jgi:anti-sigma B factor antagonist
MAQLGDAAPLEISVLADTEGPFLKLTGELDLSNVDTVRLAVDSLVASHPGRVVFDLSALSFMDTSGIALLLRTNKSVGSVKVVNPSDVVRRVIETTGLSGILRMEP